MSRSTAPWLLVARREVAVKLRDKAFVIGTLVSVLAIVAVVAFQAWQAERHQDLTLAASPGAVEMAQGVADGVPADDNLTITVTEVRDDAQATAMLKDGEAAGWLRQVDGGWELAAYDQPGSALTGAVESGVARQVLEANAERVGATAAELTAGSQVTTRLVDGDAERAVFGQVLGFVMAILFYMSAMMFGMTLASSVVEEKQSRIVEIIATSIPVTQLLVGKIVGNVVLALGQLALFLGVGLVGLSFTDLSSLLPAVSSGIAWYVAFYLAGFVVIATLFAVAGALASRVEDVQSTASPATMLLMAVFFGALFASGRVADVLSWLPPFSAVVMPMRLVTGEASAWQAVLALLVLVAVAAVLVALATRLYRRALLQTSGKLGYREAWNAEV